MVLATLSHRDLMPAIWLPDPRIREERELARFRMHLVKHKTALKCRIHSTLINFGRPCPVTDLFGAEGRELLRRLEVPEPWRSNITASLCERLAARAARARPQRQLPLRGDRRAQGRPLLHGARASRARRAGGLVRARPRRGIEPAGARRRVGGDRRQHASRRRAQHGAPPPSRRRGLSGAPRTRLRQLARADRPRRSRARRRHQRARPGPHPAGHARDPHRVRLANRRPRDVLHHVPRRHRALRGRHPC
jgi:hypothetical protein